MTSASTFIVTGCSHPEEQHIKLEQSLPMTETVAEAPLWLEEVEGKQALDKVNAWNKVTLDKLMADKRYAQYLDSGLDIVNAIRDFIFGINNI